MAPFRDNTASLREGLSRHSKSKEIDVLKKTFVSAGLVAAAAGAVLLSSGTAANADCGGCCGGGSHHHSWNHHKNKNKNHNRITIRIRIRNNNFNRNDGERDRFFRERVFDREKHEDGGMMYFPETLSVPAPLPEAVPAVG
jgi:hypothetical protein